MAQSFHVNLAFSADTAKAKASINELMSSLNQIANPKTQIFDDRGLREAANAAKDLQNHLAQAVNVNTGKLDLNKFSLSLSQSKQNLTDLYNSLSKAGPQGEQAFLQLASGIASSDSQVLNLNSKIKDLGVTLKNTVKWQLSSSLIHGFMGAVQSAIGYTRELNSSLNDIRIVTGYGADQMARFADQANKAAKSLSTTTNDYAKASLIYFQQGLSDDEVQKRTDITVKMANVANSNAELVSEQMTAVWNNFYDGSKSLEYYSDVMTALGAATASSTDEISEGLSKFAAVADTVGLSYEYATAALTTLTSNTRESADVVGNALKTLFARIQGLKLGETLEDGVDLNKYSEALDKVGISIFEQNGELKAMDNILNELGAKWDTLDKSQQVALAQTVAGVRQYTQLIALMENWDNGDADSMMANLNTAYNAGGALSEQFEIYEEGWEAASNRIEASIERIYQALLNDEAIVSLMNGLETILNLTGAILDGFGGMQGILLLISGIVTRSIAKEVPGAIDSLRQNFEIITGKAQKKKIGQMQDSRNILENATKTQTMSEGQNTRYMATINEIDAMMQLEQIRHRLSDAEYESRKNKILEKKSIEELVAAKQDELDVMKKEYEQKSKKSRTGKTNAQVVREMESQDYNRQKNILEQERLGLEKQIARLEEKAIKKNKDGKTSGLTVNDTNDLIAYRTQLEQIKQQEKEINDLITRRDVLKDVSDQNLAAGRDDSYDAYLESTKQKLTELYELQTKQSLFQQDYKQQLSNWTISGASINLIDGDKQAEEFEKIRIAMKNYGKELASFDSSLDLSNLDSQLEGTENNIESLIAAFESWAQSGVVIEELTSEAGQARGMTAQLEQQIDDVVENLRQIDPQNFRKIADEAQEAGERTANLNYEVGKLKNEAAQKDIEFDVDTMSFSEALTTVGSLGLSIGALFTEVGSAIQICFDDGATATEKFIAVLSSIPAAAMTLGEIIQGLAALPEALTSLNKGLAFAGTTLTDIAAKGGVLSGVLGKMGTAFTSAAGSAKGLLLLLGKFALVIAAIAVVVGLCVAAFEAWKASTPEGKLEAAKEATEAMATAAQDATTAYQNLLNTISGYDSAIAALENLEVGTQEFTNALITANEKAWELIDTYGLIQGQDWDYGKNGEIIINNSAKNRITKEANDIREDAVIAHSVAQVQEKEAAYNVSRSNAGMVGYDIQQGYLDQNVLYDALGLIDGSFKHTKNAIQQWQEEGIFNADVADKIAQSLYGVDWLDLDNSQLEYINNNIFKYLDEIETMFGDFSQYNSAKENQFDKQVSTVMSDEEAYQKTSWKGAVNDYLESSFESAKQEALAEYEGKTDDQINAAYEDYLKKTYIEEDGKYYRKDASGNKTGEAIEGLTGLSPEAQKDILATVDAWQVLEDKGVEMAQSFNGIANDMTDSEKDVADALLNGDLSSLTEEQIEAFKSGELSLEEAIGSSNYQQLATLLGEDYIQQLENGFKEAVNNWQPPEFNLESWKSDYAAKMDIINDLETGDTISAEDYAILGEEYSQYFQVQADGTAILIAKAEELKAAAEGIEIGELKNNIQARQDAIDNLESNEILYNETYNGLNYGRTAEFSDLHAIAGSENGFNETQSGQEIAYIEAVNTALGKNYETAQEAYAGYEAFKTSLSDEQGVMATTASSLNELNEMLQSNLITAEDYNNVFKGTIYKEASDLGIDLDELAEYADYLEEIGNLTEENALKAALAEKKQSKAADDLIDNYKDYVKVLKKADLDSKIKATEEYSKVIQSLKKDLSLLTGYEEEAFSDEFINSSAVQQVLLDISNGVEGATEKLQALAALEMLPKDVTVKLDETSYNALVQALADVSQDIEIGTTINNSNALLQLGALMEQAGYTVEQIQAAFNKLGWSPTIDYETIDVSDAENYVSNGYVQVVTGDMLSGYTVKSVPLKAINSVATNGTVRIPKIGSAGGGGGAPSTPSFTKIDNPGNGSTKKPSGGGGGSGGSKPKHAEKKNDSDKERYHTLNNQLEDLESQYDSISDAADRAFGQDKLDNIDKQIEKTQELIDKNEEYLAEAKKNASVDKSVMEGYYSKAIGGPAIRYDENGNITNFDEIQDAAYAKYNRMAETYDEESQEWITFEKDYEQFMKYLELYEESADLVRDKKAEAERLAAEKIDLELEKVQYSIEIQLEVPEDQLKVIDFQLERIEDDAFNSAESMNLLIQKANLFNREIETTKQGLIDTLGVTLSDQEINQILSGNMDGIDTSKFTEDQVSAIREYKDSLLELNQELLDIQQQIEDEVMETFEEYHEELDRGMEKFDHYNNMLESYQNIVDIVGKDVLGLDNEALADISEAQVENSINQLKASKDAYDSLQKQADDALQKQQEAEIKAALARAKGDEETAKSYEEDAEFWKETYTEMNEAAVEAQEEMMDSWGNTLEAIATQFELAVERAVKAFNDAIYEFGGLEGMSDDFSRQKEMDDMYLEDYQQIYELSKLTRDINNTIDDTENISGKQKLKKLLEEINQLQEDGVEMSEYDLEYLQAEYNLRLAELELEEAQKAKDTVRLSRDNEGNWSYVYTQNTDAVDAAQQKYEDALYAMQDLSSNYIDEMSEQLIATSQEMQEALANVRVEDFASQEEYYAELARIEAQYQEQMAAQEAELNKAIANNKELYDTDWKNYSEATGYKISKAEEFATKFSDTLLGSLVGSEEATSNFTAIVGEATDSLVQGLANAAATYYTNLNTAMEAAGTSTSEFADLLAEDVEAIKTDSAEAADAVAQMAEKMDEEMAKITERVQKFQEDYGREIDKIIAKNLEMVETFNDMLEHLSIDPDQINVTYDISRSQDDETVEVPEGTASGYTGMYTGDWGSSEGRVAVLHEKELLLNQDDTVNMLEALRISKYMLEVLNANAQMMSQGMGAMLPASIDNSISEVLEQQVSIVAEFPNAVNHSEIEEAFDTLINRAAQYANRK